MVFLSLNTRIPRYDLQMTTTVSSQISVQSPLNLTQHKRCSSNSTVK